MDQPSDCLVLKIEEYEKSSKHQKIDNSLFIFYDKKTHKYVVRGKRRDSKKHKFEPYSFICEDVEKLRNFISIIICKSNLYTYVLYNYDNLPCDSNDIYFDFLENNELRNYEIAAYDKQKYNCGHLTKILHVLRDVFNYF